MARSIFLTLPVADVARSTAFYEAIGFEKNARFSNARGSSMAWSDTVTFMLVDRAAYATLTTRPIADSRTTSAMLIALPRDSRAEVDAITEAAIAAGGAEAHGPEKSDHMYSRAFYDPDGHGFGPVWMNAPAMKAQPDTAPA